MARALVGWYIAFAWLLLAAVAFADDVPPAVQAAFDETNARIKYQPYAEWDARYVAPGSWDFGNCAVFAHTYWRELRQKGVQARIRYTKLPDGRAHVYAQTSDGWVLDNMRREVTRAEGR